MTLDPLNWKILLVLTFNLLDNFPVLAAISPTVAGAKAMLNEQQTSDKRIMVTFCWSKMIMI